MMAAHAKCDLCKEEESRYTCPRCKLVYCSVSCYKSELHLGCSEEFFKQCIVQQLEGEKLVKNCSVLEHKQLLLDEFMKNASREEEILDSDDSDLDSGDELEKRMEKVDLDCPDEIWANLSNNEKEKFQNLIDSGEISKCLPEWKPWWASAMNGPCMVEEINPTCDSQLSSNPHIKEKIPLLSTLMTKKPSEAVRYGLLNVLYGYACISRLFLNDWESVSLSTTIETLLLVSENLRSGLNFKSAVGAIENAQITACSLAKVTPELNELLKNDVVLLYKRPNYILAALSDIHRLLVKEEKRTTKRLLYNPIKKVEFYLSYVSEYWFEEVIIIK